MLKASLKIISITLVAILISMSTAWAFSVRGTQIKNNSDSWIWVTFYNGNDDIQHPVFCIAPGQTRNGEWVRSGYKYTERLRFEMTTTNCAHPRYADLWQNFGGVVSFVVTGSHSTSYKVQSYACHGSPVCH